VGSDPFAEAVAQVVEGARAGGEIAPDAVDVVLNSLTTTVVRHGVDADEASDIAAEAVTRLLELVDRDEIDARGGAGLVTVIAQRLAIDRRRRLGRHAAPERMVEQGAEDDRIVALLERGADAASVARGLRAAFDAGDLEVVRIIRLWLDLAETIGRAPSTRESAESFGVSHMSVARALQRFRQFL
jgi:DNA-directed RNA polymerase specialized sigma24 family protein